MPETLLRNAGRFRAIFTASNAAGRIEWKKDIMNKSFIAFITDPGSGIYMKFDLADGRISSPFVTADDSLPFEIVRKAGVVTSGGSTVRDVFVVMSRDEYLTYGNIDEDVTNIAVDERWNGMIGASGSGFCLPEPGPMDCGGAYPTFSPVFFCRKTARYFTPVCPACSSGLDICKDDDLLKENGLASYARSLRRYLFCPECLAKGRPAVLYAPSRRDDEPDTVQDGSALIRGFVNLLVRTDADIPCAACADRADCYGESWLALDNITSLSFYPFHAVLNEAGTMAASDFLGLVSGASFDEIKDGLRAQGFSGRLNAVSSYEESVKPSSGLMFGNDARAFLEILYLKLSFAADLMSRVVRDSGGPANSGVIPGLGSVWIVLPDSLGLLPSFWNFRTVRIKGPENDVSPAVLPAVPKGHLEYSAGRLFIYALISSRLVKRNEIDARLKEVIDASATGAPLDRDSIAGGVFGPENIFYKPENRIVKEEYLDVWKDVLWAGMNLILNGYSGGAPCIDEFVSSLNMLKEKTSEMLFAQARTITDIPADAVPSADNEEENLKIISILESIESKWLDSEKVVTEPPQGQTPTDAEETFEETVVIPVRQARKETKIIEEPEDFHETVILNAATLSGETPKAKEPEDRDEKPSVKLEDVLEETVMMSADAGRPAAQGGKSEADKRPETENMDDELSETVIIKK